MTRDERRQLDREVTLAVGNLIARYGTEAIDRLEGEVMSRRSVAEREKAAQRQLEAQTQANAGAR